MLPPNMAYELTQAIALAPYLGEVVSTPDGIMRLVEIYAHGCVGCVPLDCWNYHKELREFHASSVTLAKET